MKEKIERQLSLLNKNSAPIEIVYDDLLKNIDFSLDADYLSFIRTSDGAEGYLGSQYIMFWEIADLISLNPYYEDNEKCGNLFFFGTDGSNYGFAFPKNSPKVVGIDFLEIYEHEPEIIADTFEEFLFSYPR